MILQLRMFLAKVGALAGVLAWALAVVVAVVVVEGPHRLFGLHQCHLDEVSSLGYISQRGTLVKNKT